MTALRPAIRRALRPALRSAIGTPLLKDIQLLLAANDGALYINDISTMYQDAAGTTPVTAVDDPVGRWEDQSGNGNHATQSTAAARPLWDGEKVVFDGVDDFLETGLITLTDKWAVSYAAVINDTPQFSGPWRFLRDGGDPDATSDNRLEEYLRGGVLDRAIYSRFETSGFVSDRGGRFPAIGMDFVAWANRNPTVDESVGEIYTGSTTAEESDLLPYSDGTASLSLGRGYGGREFEGALYGYCFVVGGLSVSERDTLNEYMKSISGVSL